MPAANSYTFSPSRLLISSPLQLQHASKTLELYSSILLSFCIYDAFSPLHAPMTPRRYTYSASPELRALCLHVSTLRRLRRTSKDLYFHVNTYTEQIQNSKASYPIPTCLHTHSMLLKLCSTSTLLDRVNRAPELHSSKSLHFHLASRHPYLYTSHRYK